MEFDYQIYPENPESKISAPQWLNANTELINQATKIDKLIISVLDGENLSVKHLTTDYLHCLKIDLGSKDGNLTEKDKNTIIKDLGECKVCIFKSLPNIEDNQDFANLYQKLLDLVGIMAKKYYKLTKPAFIIPKLDLANIVAKLTTITALRPDREIKYSYADNISSFRINNTRTLDLGDLLGRKDHPYGPYTERFQIKHLPVDGSSSLALMLSDSEIKHEMQDEGFLKSWEAGGFPNYCHDHIDASTVLHQHADPKKNLYVIKKVIRIVRREGETQTCFDFDNSHI